MKRYSLSLSARNDLRGIYEYIRQDNPRAAKRVMQVLREAIRKIGASPERGHLREDLADESVRFWSEYSYLIIYRAHTRPIEVLRVIHGARDVQAILEENP